MIAKQKLVYQFKVMLKDVEPAIWRRIVVPGKYTFWDLHVAIQDAMGWLDYHLHLFRIIDPDSSELVEIGIPDEEPFEDDLGCVPGWERSIAHFFRGGGDHADYEYDFGDGWEHEVILEGIFPREATTKYPKCIDGARACPPEDCGGVDGFQRMLKIIRSPSHKEHKSMMKWLGGKYDPDAFDPTIVRFDNPKKRWNIAFLEEEK